MSGRGPLHKVGDELVSLLLQAVDEYTPDTDVTAVVLVARLNFPAVADMPATTQILTIPNVHGDGWRDLDSDQRAILVDTLERSARESSQPFVDPDDLPSLD